ncbi:hypothetical protein DFH11DRAFT_1881537 [Phellopilus nigrolimitatus]|nr:hypothetical protein DFH11DRAFT_1881537 [Phellopilus nigrolimitatus]
MSEKVTTANKGAFILDVDGFPLSTCCESDLSLARRYPGSAGCPTLRAKACAPSRSVRTQRARLLLARRLGLGFILGWGAAKPIKAAVAVDADECRRHAKRAEEAAEEAAAEGEDASCAEEDEQAKRVEGERGRRTDEGGDAQRQWPQGDSDANVGSNFDATPNTGEGKADDTAAGEDDALADAFSVRDDVHGDEEDGPGSREKYVLDDWKGTPDSFVCQEYTGGRNLTESVQGLSGVPGEAWDSRPVTIIAYPLI